MKGPFFLFAAFACTLTQNFLEIMASSSSSTSRIQTDMATDYSTNEAMKTVADLQYRKLADNVFNSLEDLAKLACGGQNLPENSANITKTSKAEALAALTTQFDVTLLAILSINPEAYSEISALRVSGHASIQIVIDNIYQGFHLAQKKNSSGFLKEIEALENKTLAAALTANNMIHSAFRYGEGDLPKIGATIRNVQEKSVAQITIAVRKTFRGIKALQVANNSGPQVGCEIVFRTIKIARHQTSSALMSDNEIKFGLIKKLLSAVFIIQSGFVINFSTIQAIQTAAVSDYKNAMNGIHTITQNNSSEASTEHENGNMNDPDALQAAENVANVGEQMAISIIFSLLEGEFARLREGNQCLPEDEESIIDIAETEEYIAFKSAVDSFLNATVIAQPEASSVVTSVRHPMHLELCKAVEGIQAGIRLIIGENSKDIPTEIEALQEISTWAARNVTEEIFKGIKNGRSSWTQMGTAIERIQEETYSLVTSGIHSIFHGIKIVLIEAFPEYDVEGDGCHSSIEAVRYETSHLFSAIVDSIFSAIRLASTRKQIEIPKNSCSSRGASRLD